LTFFKLNDILLRILIIILIIATFILNYFIFYALTMLFFVFSYNNPFIILINIIITHM
jgi:hypothetical protein